MKSCRLCGTGDLFDAIKLLNTHEILSKRISWHQWKSLEGKSGPQKCLEKGTVSQGLNELMRILHSLSQHLFRTNWHRNVFYYIKRHIIEGIVLQVLDFAKISITDIRMRFNQLTMM